jgi:hypothetical protein
MSKNKLAEVRQCRFSQGVVFFKENFMRHWQLAEYSHSFMPALFCGIYNGQDIKAVNEHGGVAMVMPCGSDIHNVRHIRADAIIVCSDNDLPAISSLFKGRIKKTIRIAMKDYSAFKPVRLGDKIYAYCPPKFWIGWCYITGQIVLLLAVTDGFRQKRFMIIIMPIRLLIFN